VETPLLAGKEMITSKELVKSPSILSVAVAEGTDQNLGSFLSPPTLSISQDSSLVGMVEAVSMTGAVSSLSTKPTQISSALFP
jgi:hypothetical protein